jgi:hypothetical protein
MSDVFRDNAINEKYFKIEMLDCIFKKITDTFSENFKLAGYIEHDPEPLISDIDHSVRFIGSTTNVFKQYLTDNVKISGKGYFLIQKCLRTRNASTFFSDDIFPEWSSYFTAMGIMSPSGNVETLLTDTLNFLLNLGIEVGKIRINVSSRDKDLLECVRNVQKKIKFLIDVDGVDNINYYRHKYGMDEINGRNFNLAIKNEKTEEFKDIGNIVVIEEGGAPLAVEMGIGVSTLIAKIFGLDNSIEASTISKIVTFKPGFTSKFADALSAAVVMLREKINPGSRDKARLLRTHLRALTYFRFKLGISLEDIKNFADKYEKEEFGEITNIGDIIVLYLEDYEDSL